MLGGVSKDTGFVFIRTDHSQSCVQSSSPNQALERGGDAVGDLGPTTHNSSLNPVQVVLEPPLIGTHSVSQRGHDV